MKPPKRKSLKEELQDLDTKTRREVFNSVADDDMPDGAYFAMAEEFGLDPTDLVD